MHVTAAGVTGVLVMGRKFRLDVHRKNQYLKLRAVKRKCTAVEEPNELTVTIPLDKIHLTMMISIPQDTFLVARVHTLMQVVQRLKIKPVTPEGNRIPCS